MSTEVNMNSATEMLAKNSIQEALGSYKDYDSQLELQSIKGTRVVKCLYQVNTKTGKKVRDSQYVRIPVTHLSLEGIIENAQELAPYVLTFLQNVEDIMIKADHKKGATSLYTDGLSLSKLVDWLELNDQGIRLDAELIEAWFDSEIVSSLLDLFIAKIGDADPSKLELILSNYKTKFVSLASGKCNLVKADCLAMIAVLENVDDKLGSASSLSPRLKIKLEAIIKRSVDKDLLLSL